MLVGRIIAEARTLNVAALYLFTPNHEQMYARLGWRLVQREMYHGAGVAIMRLALA